MKRALAGLAGLALFGGAARADTSYRGQILISDGVSDGLIATSAWTAFTNATKGSVSYLGLAGYALGAPIVHATHDDWGTAGISLGTRVAAPALLGWAAYGACLHWGGEHRDLLPCFGSGALGILTGMAAAQVLDWTVLDHTDAPKTILFQLGGGF